MKLQPIYIIVLTIVLITIFSLPFVKVPISVSSRGIVRPEQENTKIFSMVGGRVVRSVLAKINQKVEKNDTLLVITSDELVNQRGHNLRLRQDYLIQQADLKKLVNNQFTGLNSGQYQRELSSMNEKIAEIDAQLTLSGKELVRNKILYDEGVVPEAEYEKNFFAHEQLKVQKRAIKEVQMAQWYAQLRTIEREINTIKADLNSFDIQDDNHIIKAQINGRVVKFSGLQVGNYVIQGQEIAEISPEDKIIAECMVSPSDIGYIKNGQKVKFQIDTYNYNQWGMITGTVFDIDKNIVFNSESGVGFFRVRCHMDRNYLALKNGYKGNISKGQTFTARFYLTDRTLWQLLFDKVDDWFNPKLL